MYKVNTYPRWSNSNSRLMGVNPRYATSNRLKLE